MPTDHPSLASLCIHTNHTPPSTNPGYGPGPKVHGVPWFAIFVAHHINLLVLPYIGQLRQDDINFDASWLSMNTNATDFL